MDAELGPRCVGARRVACLAIATISGAVRDDPNRADGMVALLKEIYGRRDRPRVAVAYGVLVVFADARLALALALVLVLWYT
jgi:hypothetical protein